MTVAIWPRVDTAAIRRLQAKAARRRQQAQLASPVSLHPKTGQIRKGIVERRAFGLTLRLPKRLPSPNRWIRLTWRRQYQIKAAWAEAIRLAVFDSCSAGRALARMTTPAGAAGWIAPPVRARVTFTRHVLQPSHLIRDDDNLRFTVKALLDCVVQAGFLRDDSRDHVELAVEQVVSADGLEWTVIDIDARDEAAS